MEGGSISDKIADATAEFRNLGLEDSSAVTRGDWNALPPEVHDLIVALRPFPEIFQARAICRGFRDVVKRANFQRECGRLRRWECFLSPLVFYVKNGLWHILGLDYKARIWRPLPPFQDPIPAPDIDLFNDFLVAGDGGLFCVNVGKPSEAERIYVCNPLTGVTRKLPPLEFSRHPVVLNLRVTLAQTGATISSSYRVIAVGSAATGTGDLSRKTEVYDSAKGKWEAAGDVPGSDFSLNDHQTGVFCERENLLLCTGFMVNGSKGILAFDVGKRKWREHWLCPLFLENPAADAALAVHFAITQLTECGGAVYLFSEQESGRDVTHCIDTLEFVTNGPGVAWTRKVTRPRQAYRSLLVHPEYTCVPVGQNQLCIFNTIDRTGVVYNMLDDPINPDATDTIPAPPPMGDGVVFHSLNPVGYAFQPSFGVSL